MNKLEQDTLEVIQEFLPRIAVALEEIAKELKKHKNLNEVAKNDSTEPNESDVMHISKSEAYHRIRRAGIPVTESDDGDILVKGDLIIGEYIAYLSPEIEGNKVVTSSDTWVFTQNLTLAHIDKFILEYKTLEKVVSK